MMMMIMLVGKRERVMKTPHFTAMILKNEKCLKTFLLPTRIHLSHFFKIISLLFSYLLASCFSPYTLIQNNNKKNYKILWLAIKKMHPMLFHHHRHVFIIIFSEAEKCIVKNGGSSNYYKKKLCKSIKTCV